MKLYFSVPVETTAFLGACAGFVALLLVVVLYLSRKWCYIPPSSTTLFGGVCVPLCEANNTSTSTLSKNLGTNHKTYSNKLEQNIKIKASNHHIILIEYF